jgi:hypothetical protein
MSKSLTFRLLTLAGLALLAAAYFSPVWWVSLKAPNYPPETFPQGVRIEFYFDHVGNGCAVRQNKEVEEEGEALDCVHEMNTINHFIGMHPIASGARYELASAPYIFPVMGLLLLAFMFYGGPFWWLLAIPATLTPLVFVLDYAAWLWWFGHTLSPMGAFTIKPFMPTVFGEGKVAQFSTYSYPSYGFGLTLVCSACLILAMLVRRKQLRGE